MPRRWRGLVGCPGAGGVMWLCKVCRTRRASHLSFIMTEIFSDGSVCARMHAKYFQNVSRETKNAPDFSWRLKFLQQKIYFFAANATTLPPTTRGLLQ